MKLKRKMKHLKRHGSSPKIHEKNEPMEWNGGYAAFLKSIATVRCTCDL